MLYIPTYILCVSAGIVVCDMAGALEVLYTVETAGFYPITSEKLSF